MSTAVLKCDRDLLTLSLLIQLHKHVSPLTSVEASGECGVAIHFATLPPTRRGFMNVLEFLLVNDLKHSSEMSSSEHGCVF